jgi:hypothetical protein
LIDTTFTPAEYEEDANRIRTRLGATISQLRVNLHPANLIDEAARGSGFRDATPAGVFDYGVRRHPIPTALVGLGVGLFAFSLLRSRSAGGAGAKGFVSDAAGSLARSATNVFRERADSRRRAFVGAANAHIKAGASQLSDMIENSVDAFIGKIPATPAARPLVESAIQVALLAAVEALLPKAK